MKEDELSVIYVIQSGKWVNTETFGVLALPLSMLALKSV